MKLENGTYLKLGLESVKVHANGGYWVAIGETTRESLNDGELFGVWTDGETGKVWIDRVLFIESKATALNTAKANNQLAIWDNFREMEVRL